jgi:hypothetical protein
MRELLALIRKDKWQLQRVPGDRLSVRVSSIFVSHDRTQCSQCVELLWVEKKSVLLRVGLATLRVLLYTSH